MFSLILVNKCSWKSGCRTKIFLARSLFRQVYYARNSFKCLMQIHRKGQDTPKLAHKTTKITASLWTPNSNLNSQFLSLHIKLRFPTLLLAIQIEHWCNFWVACSCFEVFPLLNAELLEFNFPFPPTICQICHQTKGNKNEVDFLRKQFKLSRWFAHICRFRAQFLH